MDIRLQQHAARTDNCGAGSLAGYEVTATKMAKKWLDKQAHSQQPRLRASPLCWGAQFRTSALDPAKPHLSPRAGLGGCEISRTTTYERATRVHGLDEPR